MSAPARVAVLGASGFLGTNLCVRFMRDGVPFRGLARTPRHSAIVAGATLWRSADFRDGTAVRAVVDGADVVYHLVSSTTPAASVGHASEDLRDNVAPTTVLLDACRDAGVRMIVFASTGGSIYSSTAPLPTPESAPTDPISPYSAGKLAVEKCLDAYAATGALDCLSLRISNPFGPWQFGHGQGVIAAFMRAALRGEPIRVRGDGSAVRDYLHVDDVVDAFVAAATYHGPHTVLNIGSGIGRRLSDVIASIEEVTGIPLRRVIEPMSPADVRASVLDCTAARRELSWQPRVSWRDGLRRTLEWHRSNLAVPARSAGG